MRDFTDKSRFTVRSVPEIFQKVTGFVAALKANHPGLDGRVSREIVLNALFCHFDALPLESQLAIFESGLDRLRPLLAEPGDLAALPAPTPPEVPVAVRDDSGPPPPSVPSKKRKQGA